MSLDIVPMINFSSHIEISDVVIEHSFIFFLIISDLFNIFLPIPIIVLIAQLLFNVATFEKALASYPSVFDASI